MNRLLSLATLFGLLVATLAQADERIRLKVGASALFSLQENITTGYSWRTDSEASEGLDLIAIADAGRSGAPSKMVGSPSVRHWKITALKPGQAQIVFVYQRPWEPAPVQTRRVEVEVAP
ncbi:protease inhibitor I42 family protein [Methylocystis sp. 9N]|uniref:Protease inhibitor I42 family protein n=1 Tax=Methylocystis borbori TaxID=3118750 RepID=A0ABU7XEI4_9HYPH